MCGKAKKDLDVVTIALPVRSLELFAQLIVG